ncbi:phage head closure protein [Massilia agilis]|uniref:Phage head closure protein n=1 Tax=Massilia agilis TaxID=1811226 RepID=A0ABT2DCU6_9BURK|nr:phage head closure protein [Massilia agilis]MCS0808684.1 phage head closure protein [Massilia agilis]
MRDRVRVYRKVAGTGSVGQPTTSLELVRPAWADVRMLGGLETVRADAQVSVARGSARLRYCTDITEGMVVEYAGAKYKVTAQLPNRADGYVDLTLESIK